jgi:hypothetical protein
MVTSRIWFTAAQKAELWEQWKEGQSAAAISRALERKNKTGVERIVVAAIRMSHLGNSSSKCDPSKSCPSPRLGHSTKKTCVSVLSGDRAARSGGR